MANKFEIRMSESFGSTFDNKGEADIRWFLATVYPLLVSFLKSEGISILDFVLYDGMKLNRNIHAAFLANTRGRIGRTLAGGWRVFRTALLCGATNKATDAEIKLFCSERGIALGSKFAKVETALKAIDSVDERARLHGLFVRILRENLATETAVDKVVGQWFATAGIDMPITEVKAKAEPKAKAKGRTPEQVASDKRNADLAARKAYAESYKATTAPRLVSNK